MAILIQGRSLNLKGKLKKVLRTVGVKHRCGKRCKRHASIGGVKLL